MFEFKSETQLEEQKKLRCWDKSEEVRDVNAQPKCSNMILQQHQWICVFLFFGFIYYCVTAFNKVVEIATNTNPSMRIAMG